MVVKARIIFFIGIFCFWFLSDAAQTERRFYYPAEFYQQVEAGIRDDDLRELLFEVLNSAHFPTEDHDTLGESCDESESDDECYEHSPVGYKTAKNILFGELHREDFNGRKGVRDLYCYEIGDQDKNLNTEHTWPQSRFSKNFHKEMQKSDLHILFPVQMRANSIRSNLPFADVERVTSEPCEHSRRGYAKGDNRTQYFEVPDDHKGNAARAIFYFAVRYQLPISKIEEDSLKAWHMQDPVDTFEAKRNELIFAKQKVRNPFVDHPELVNRISDF